MLGRVRVGVRLRVGARARVAVGQVGDVVRMLEGDLEGEGVV